ncbi:MAG TPA: branched-chain amino acid ABC transporter permease, partial [Salinarimonas sp.]|nr:branched-chain amino acid ABC transporter permease [Salinarimonas sp.]
MTLDLFVTVTMNGLTLAALYFIVASGFSLIFGLMRTVNMAHGSLYLVGAYIGYAVFDPLHNADSTYAISWWVGILGGVLAAALVGVLMQVTLLGWMQGQELRQALITIGLSIIIADQILAHFGGNSRQFFPPDALFGSSPFPIIDKYPTFRLVQIVIAVLVGVGLWLLL